MRARVARAMLAIGAVIAAGCELPVLPVPDAGATGGAGGAPCEGGCPDEGACAVDDDCPGPRGQCGRPQCLQGICALDNEYMEAPCDENGGHVCDGAGSCVECLHGAECASGVCSAQHCAAPACDDGVANGGESDADCGGPCAALCGLGAGCAAHADCAGGLCDPTTHTCAPSCADGLVSPTIGETDVDCGGPACALCKLGFACVASLDCASGNCDAGHCAPAPDCFDGLLDNGESDVDCGGPACEACADGDDCVDAADCQSGVCEGNVCAIPACADGVQNGGEAGLDCGLVACATPCPAGAPCASGADCESGVCAPAMICAAPACNDGVYNGGETDVDCGGTCPKQCGPLKDCYTGTDCIGGLCDPATHTCEPTCNDGIQDGDETDLDCGGSCAAKCGVLLHCAADADCVTANCFEGHCYP